MPNTVETNAIFRVSTKPIHAVEHVKSNKGYTVQTGYACGSITLQSGGHNDSLKNISRFSKLPDNLPQSPSTISLNIQKENKIVDNKDNLIR
mgnify:FL=1